MTHAVHKAAVESGVASQVDALQDAAEVATYATFGLVCCVCTACLSWLPYCIKVHCCPPSAGSVDYEHEKLSAAKAQLLRGPQADSQPSDTLAV